MSSDAKDWVEREMSSLINSVTRYTHFVRSTKIGLGAIAIVLIGMVLFYPIFHKQAAGVRITFTATQKAPPPTSMKTPDFHGLDKDNQPYNMLAKLATEVGEDLIDLVEPSGDILMKNNQHLSVNAKTGVFNKKDHTLALKGDIHMFNDVGDVLITETMQVDIANKTATTSSEVHGSGPSGTLKAYGGAIADGKNQLIIFEGPVFVKLNMDNKNKDKQDKQEKQK